jgi:hypothetical protein
MTTDGPIDDLSESEAHCKVCGCLESLHNVFSGKCTGGQCMCPGLITDDEDYLDFLAWRRSMISPRL